jgi:hypothetical protein
LVLAGGYAMFSGACTATIWMLAVTWLRRIHGALMQAGFCRHLLLWGSACHGFRHALEQFQPRRCCVSLVMNLTGGLLSGGHTAFEPSRCHSRLALNGW